MRCPTRIVRHADICRRAMRCPTRIVRPADICRRAMRCPTRIVRHADICRRAMRCPTRIVRHADICRRAMRCPTRIVRHADICRRAMRCPTRIVRHADICRRAMRCPTRIVRHADICRRAMRCPTRIVRHADICRRATRCVSAWRRRGCSAATRRDAWPNDPKRRRARLYQRALKRSGPARLCASCATSPGPLRDARWARGRASTTRRPGPRRRRSRCSRGRRRARRRCLARCRGGSFLPRSQAMRTSWPTPSVSRETKGSYWRMLLLDVLGQERAGVVARQAHRGLRQVVGAEGEELGDLRQLVREQRGARQLDHGAELELDRDALRREDLGGDLVARSPS